MKYIFFLTGLWFAAGSNSFDIKESKSISASFTTKDSIPDSTIKQRFIASLLGEYEQEGRWVFVKMVRCNYKSSYEIVEPMSLYKALAEKRKSLDTKQFVWIALENLYVHNEFANCPEEAKIYFPDASYVIKGRQVNMKRYNKLKKLPFDKVLKTYFRSDGVLLYQNKKMLNELIAVCYENNVKLIAPENGKPRYEIFK